MGAWCIVVFIIHSYSHIAQHGACADQHTILLYYDVSYEDDLGEKNYIIITFTGCVYFIYHLLQYFWLELKLISNFILIFK